VFGSFGVQIHGLNQIPLLRSHYFPHLVHDFVYLVVLLLEFLQQQVPFCLHLLLNLHLSHVVLTCEDFIVLVDVDDAGAVASDDKVLVEFGPAFVIGVVGLSLVD